MKKLRVIVATLGAALAIGLFPAPAQATHHCMAEPENDVLYAVYLACEVGPHQPVDALMRIICLFDPNCP